MKIASLAVAVSLVSSAALANPVGRYDVDGKSPDGSTYSGVATIEPTGQTFVVTWLIGKDKFVGTAVGNDEFFAVAYRSGSSTGVAVYGREGNDWIGVWTFTGGRQAGVERLTRR
jgi:hypothetical protein